MFVILTHGVFASIGSRIMNKLQSVFVVMNLVLILASIIALPVGRSQQRNDGHFIFDQLGNLTTWPEGWAFMLAWLSPIWTIGGFDSCVSSLKSTIVYMHTELQAHGFCRSICRRKH